MKAATLSGFSPVILGGGLAIKIIAAAVVLATMAGGAYYALTQKSYAPETIQFDGRTFYLVGERIDNTGKIGDTGKIFSSYDIKPDNVFYAAGYTDTPETPKKGFYEYDILYYRVMYAANPAPEFVHEDGVYSAVAREEHEWNKYDQPDQNLLYQIRKPGGDSIFRLLAHGAPFAQGARVPTNDAVVIRPKGARCGASRKNAYICFSFVSWARNEKYADLKKWANAEGAAHLERVYDALAEYPLTHNEILLADMAEAVQ